MIRVHHGLQAAEADWRAAEASLAHHLFQRYDWVSAWQETIGAARGVRPLIVVVAGKDGAPRLLLPLGLVRWRGLRTLVPLGAPVSDYRGPMVAADFDAATFPAVWRDILAALPRADLVRMERVPEEVEGVPCPLVRLPGARPTERAWMTPLPPDMAAYRATRRKSFFANNRRKWRRLAEVGPLRFELVGAPEEEGDGTPEDALGHARAARGGLDEVMAELRREKRRRWQETGAADGFADPAFAAFYDAAGPRLGAALHASLLRVGDTPVAVHWGAVHAGRYYYLMIGSRAGDWARHSPGLLMVEALVADAIRRGLRVFDLTVGDEAYKREWADGVMRLWEVRQGLTAAGRAALAAETAWGMLRERAREVSWLRAIVRKVRARGKDGPAGQGGT